VENKLYVGNLSFSATQADLEQLFGQYGTVTSANIITDKFTGRSRGFAFVEMQDGNVAQEAIKALNDTEFQTRQLIVNVAKPQNKGGKGGSGGGGGRFSDRRPSERF
jgi:RNA recognition motif-containing protein